MLLRLLMQSVIPHIKEGSDSRALIYDAKADILPILDGMGVNAPVWILNPFDERSAAWEIGVDVTAPATAQQIATILIAPGKNESQPFFTDAARALLTGVMISFIKRSPGKWLLSDVIHATRTTQSLREVLSATEETKYLIDQYLREDLTANNILSSLATKLQPFEFIAAAWDRAENRISLRDWLASDSILVLGNDEAVRSALDAINRVIFRRIVELTLAETESTTRRTWFFLDELRQAGALDGLNNLLTAGRSKGACVVVGAQDIEGLREVYGENKANELLGLCGHKALLRLDSPITAKWASELFGTVEDLERRRSHSSGTSHSAGHSNTSSGSQTSEQHVVRDVVLPSEFLSLPFPNRSNGMIGYFLSPEFGGAGYRAHVSGDWIAGDLNPLGTAPALLARAEDHQFLTAWSDTRRAELGLGAANQKIEPRAAVEGGNLDSVLDEVLATSKERKKELS
jgi:type IV secretory pathway TraG/TraD family ATPase VirD4